MSPGDSSKPTCRGTGKGTSGRGSSGRGSGRSQPWVSALTLQDAQASNAVMTGTLQVCSFEIYILFDLGSTHSYVSLYFASRCNEQSVMLDHSF